MSFLVVLAFVLIGSQLVMGQVLVYGEVDEQDWITPIENATVTFSGVDTNGDTVVYQLVTDSLGYFADSINEGMYWVWASAEGYETEFQADSLEIVEGQYFFGLYFALHVPILGYRIGSLAYITDMKTIAEEEIPYIQGCDTLVVNALREKPHHSHQTLSEAVRFAQRINARQTWLIHSSHDIGRHAEVNASLPANIQLAFDGQVLEL